MRKLKLFLISFISAFILVYLVITISYQIFNRNVGGKGTHDFWACNDFRNYYRCDFKEFIDEQIFMWPFIVGGVGVPAIPVSVIIYLALTHRERVQKK